jgi:hypothetical protein
MTLSITTLWITTINAGCPNGECFYAEGHVFIAILNVVRRSVITLNVVTPLIPS